MRSAATPMESTIDRYRQRFWPTQDLTSGFPRDSREPGAVFPPRMDFSATPPQLTFVRPNQQPTIEPTTLI